MCSTQAGRTTQSFLISWPTYLLCQSHSVSISLFLAHFFSFPLTLLSFGMESTANRFASFSLTLRSSCPSYVAASSPDPADFGRIVPMGLAGNFVPRHLTTEMMYLYTEEMPSALLQAALGNTLNSFPALAGRIHEGEPGSLHVTQDNAGAVWVEAEANGITLAQLRPPAQPMEGGSMSSSWTYDDFPQSLFASSHYSRPLYGGPTLMVQSTRLRLDGSMLVSVWMDHACHDACSFLQFVNAWAAVSKAMFSAGSLGPPSRPCFPAPVRDERLIDSAAQPSKKFDHAVDFSIRPAVQQEGETASQPPPPCRGRLYHFSVAQLAHLKAVAVQALATLPEAERPAYLSTMDSLHAHLWSVVNEARRVPTTKVPLRFMQTVTMRRGRLQPSLPASFSGAAHFETSCQVPGDAASADNPRSLHHLGQRAAALRNRILTVSQPNFIASLLYAYSQANPRDFLWPVPFGHPTDLITSSWQAFAGVHSADFGYGSPVACNYNLPPAVANTIILLPSPQEEGSLDAWIGQPTKAYETMVKLERMYDFGYCDD